MQNTESKKKPNTRSRRKAKGKESMAVSIFLVDDDVMCVASLFFLFSYIHASTDRPARLMNKDRTACDTRLV